MKGMRAYVFRWSLGDCTNGGATEAAKSVLLVGEGVPEVCGPTPGEPVLMVKKHYGDFIAVGESPHPSKNIGPMFGGNYVMCDDSRFPVKHPIRVHDRWETELTYRILSS